MLSRSDDRARIVAPPPLIYLTILGLGLLTERFWSTEVLAAPSAVWVGSVLVVAGLAGIALSIRSLFRAQTPVDPYKSTKTIVTGGLFRYSRNPIYSSLILVYFGLSLLIDTWWPLILTPLLVWLMNIGVIEREEAYLEQKFGDAYLSYKQTVRRWI